MAGFADTAGLLFRISADGSQAKREIKDVKGEIEGSSSSIGNALSGLAGPASIAAAGIAAIGAAAVTAGNTLFNLAQQAADYGSKIYDASQKTGLHAETLTALKFAADQSGSSFEQVTKGITLFQAELGKAEQGQDKAVQAMKALGVSSTDTREALAQAIRTIFEAKDANVQVALAAEAFGKKIGPDLIPLIKDAGGNLDDLEQKARDLGITIDDKTAAAADAFGDSLDTLKTQLGGIGRTIGFAVMPVFLDMSQKWSEWFTRNKGEIQSWAESFGGAMQRAIKEMDAVQSWLDDHPAVLGVIKQVLWNAITGNPGGFLMPAFPGAPPSSSSTTNTAPKAPGSTIPTVGNDEAGKAASEAEKARKEAEERAQRLSQRDASAAVRIETENLRTQKEELEKTLDDLRAQYENDGDFTKFAAAVADTFAQAKSNFQATLTYIEALERKLQASDATDNERALLRQEQTKRRNDLVEFGQRQQAKNQDSVEKKRKEYWTAEEKALLERVDLIEKAISRTDGLSDATENYLEKTREGMPGRSKNGTGANGEDDNDFGTSLHDSLAGQFGIVSPLKRITDEQGDVMDVFKSQGEFMKDVMADVADGIGQSIASITQGLGSMLAAWLATGKFSAKAALQMASGVALGLAMQAGVKAIFEVAEGYAALAQVWWNPAMAGVAAMHFSAAATYGTVAAVAGAIGVGTGLAARAFGGGGNNALSSQSGRATSSPVERNVSGQGTPFSGQPDRDSEATRNGPMEVVLTVNERNPRWFSQMFEMEIRNNGPARRTIRDGAAA